MGILKKVCHLFGRAGHLLVMSMNIFKKSPTFDDISDASLVLASLGGDRNAFGKIVGRYQSLLCSVAYSSLGSLNESEDMAQEAFVEAWKKLESLHEPEKLKSWLCGILRFKISHFRRKDARQAVSRASELDEAVILASEEEGIEEATMREEEKALLWEALEKVPETYREPLVLYYREHQSIEHVAYELDLTESTVRQRLSRGRKVLQERMMSFVEDALAKSKPGSVFTMGVLAALPTLPATVKAATLGTAAVKVGSWLKWASLITFLATVSGLVSSFFALRANLEQSRTKRERRNVVKTTLTFLAVCFGFVGGMFALEYFAVKSYEISGYYAVAAQVLMVGFVVSFVYLTFRLLRNQQRLRKAERLRRPDLFEASQDQPEAKKREYKSRLRLFGIPFVHIKFAMQEEGESPAVGWIALGDRAYGVLFALGGFATGTVSVGIVSFGAISIGAVGFGIIGMGTVGIGLLAFGATAIGYKAYAGMAATGWDSAFSGGFSVANEGAIGQIAFAAQTNNELAAEIANLSTVTQSYTWVLGVMTILVIVPMIFYSNSIRKNMRKEKVD